jgi:hypothetical protein
MDKHRIFFEKPNLKLFDSMGLMSVDMHFHTNYSDSFTTVGTLLRKAARRRIGVSVTDHNEVRGCQKAYNNTKGVMVIPGIEVSCSEGAHILLYFYNINELSEFYEKHIKARKQGNPYLNTTLTVSELIEASRGFNCIRTSAHPYGYAVSNCGLAKCVSKHIVPDVAIDSIDALEVICSAMNRRLNKKAEAACITMGKCFTGGSDGHTIFDLGHAVTASHAGSVDEFLTNIVKKKNYVVGVETKLLPKLIPGTNMLGKHMRYSLETVKIKYQMSNRVKSITDKLNGITKDKP